MAFFVFAFVLPFFVALLGAFMAKSRDHATSRLGVATYIVGLFFLMMQLCIFLMNLARVYR